MEKSEVVSMPVRQVKARQSFQQEGHEEDSTIRMFSMENVADRVFHRRKKGGVDDFEEEMAEGGPASDLCNQLAVLQDDSDEDIQKEDMDDWLKKLHIRTQHIIGKVTPAAMIRLAATNHVATAAIRLKGKYRLGNETSDNEGTSPTSETAESTPSGENPETLRESISTPVNSQKQKVEEGHRSKDGAVRSKKSTKQSEENKAPRRKKAGTKAAPETRKTSKHSTEAGSAPTGNTVDGDKKTKAKSTKSPRSSKSTAH